MRKRSQARKIAMKLLYEAEVSGSIPPSELAPRLRQQTRDESIIAFSAALVRGVRANWDFLNSRISSAADHWQLGRMGIVERNILRIALYELYFLDDIPPKVSINEAVELAKKYANKDSPAFVNGILDRIWKEVQASNA